MSASARGSTDAVGQLLDHGADVNAQDKVYGGACGACAGTREGMRGGDTADSGGGDAHTYACT